LNFLFALIALFCFLPGCKLPGESSSSVPDLGVAVRSYISAEDPTARPMALVATDFRTIVAWGDAKSVSEMFIKTTGADLLPPLTYEGQRVVVRHKPTGYEWESDMVDPFVLPDYAATVAFKPGEAERWGVTFFAPMVMVNDPEMPEPAEPITPEMSAAHSGA
jgi:hypothetical protein